MPMTSHAVGDFGVDALLERPGSAVGHCAEVLDAHAVMSVGAARIGAM